MKVNKAIFKIGGSVLESPKSLKNTLSQLKKLVQGGFIKNIIIIPGGGSYANFIRELDQKLAIGNTMAHWMAIYAMDYNGKKIGSQYPSIYVTENYNEIRKFNYPISLFLPFKHLKLLDPLPNSWDITSDAITLYIAKLLKLNQTFLIKDVDGILDHRNKVIKNLIPSKYSHMKKLGKLAKLDSNKNEIKKSKPIDDYTLDLIEVYNLSCILLNGAIDTPRIYHFFTIRNETDKIYSKISFS